MNKKICVYCGTKNPTEKDHVPPKGIFGKPRPNNLVKVPCCSKCHSGTSMDDEYFRNILVMNYSVHDHPDVQKVLPTVFRSFKKKNKIRFTKSILNTMKEMEVNTPSGIYLGKWATYEFDKHRLDKVVERTAKGLYWKEKGRIFPTKGNVKSYLLNNPELLKNDTLNRIINNLLQEGEKTIGNNTVKYRMAETDDNLAEYWLITFFEKIEFLVFLILTTNELTQPNHPHPTVALGGN